MGQIEIRLEELRAALRSESISYSELAELQNLAGHIEPGDVELLEAAGVPEHSARELAEVYPEGRTFFYEGLEDAAGKFVDFMQSMGLKVTIEVHVPAERLDVFYKLDLPVGT